MNSDEKEEGRVCYGAMKVSKGGYRETESGLEASFLWSHDKSEKKGRDGKKGGKEERIERSCKATKGEERKSRVLLVVFSQRITKYANME